MASCALLLESNIFGRSKVPIQPIMTGNSAARAEESLLSDNFYSIHIKHNRRTKSTSNITTSDRQRKCGKDKEK